MSINSILKSNPALQEPDTQNEEWHNFMHKVGEVSTLVKDLASGDRERSDAAEMLANKYLDGKVLLDENIKMQVKCDRTVINRKAFKAMGDDGKTQDPESWMAEVSKDAERRYQDKQVRREKADTFNTQAMKAFRREEYDRALSCYNKAIEQIRDNPMLYCDRALTYIRLGKFDKVIKDCDIALRLNENSFKARLYKTRAYKEMEDTEKLQESLKELEETFPQHKDLVDFFLGKSATDEESDEVKVDLKF